VTGCGAGGAPQPLHESLEVVHGHHPVRGHHRRGLLQWVEHINVNHTSYLPQKLNTKQTTTKPSRDGLTLLERYDRYVSDFNVERGKIASKPTTCVTVGLEAISCAPHGPPPPPRESGAAGWPRPPPPPGPNSGPRNAAQSRQATSKTSRLRWQIRKC